MAHTGDCFLVPGPVRMNDACLKAMATPVMTAVPTVEVYNYAISNASGAKIDLCATEPSIRRAWRIRDRYSGRSRPIT